MDLMDTKYITVSGVIKATPGRYKGAVLLYGTADAGLNLYDGADANGKRIDSLKAVAGNPAPDHALGPDSIPFSQLYAELSGAGAGAIVRFV